MKKATLRDLRYHFDRVQDLLQAGEEIQITKRSRVVARLLPPGEVSRPPMPDFPKRQKEIFGNKVFEVSGAELLAEERKERF